MSAANERCVAWSQACGGSRFMSRSGPRSVMPPSATVISSRGSSLRSGSDNTPVTPLLEALARPLDQVQELLAGLALVAEDAAHAGGDRDRVLFLDAAH